MFKIHRQPQGEGAVKKSIQKLFDPKKDVATRLKHLKNVIDNSPEIDVQNLFELHYSHIYYIFFENFLLAESNLRLKGSHRAQREELDSILIIFEQILVNLPDLIHQRWQYHSIDTVIKRLLHTQNSLKVRREGMNFFLLWLRALCENALPHTLLLYACLVPGFPPPVCNGKPYSLEWLVNVPINEEYGVHQVEIMCLVPPPSGEKSPIDITKYFLDALLEFMVLKSRVLRWKDKEKVEFKSFSFLWDLFKEYYLPHAFTDFNSATSIYSCNLDLPEPRDSVNYILNVSDSGSIDPNIEVASGCSMLAARVSIIKWVVAFTGSFERNETVVPRTDTKIEALQQHVLKQLQELNGSSNEKEAEISDSKPSLVSASSAVPARSQPPDTDASNSNTSTLTEKEPSISSLSSLDDKLRSSGWEEDIVRRVLYSTRQNVNIVQELFRQAFMLPLTEVPAMRRVVKVYQQWIQEGEVPIFMESPSADEIFSAEVTDGKNTDRDELISSIRNTSYMQGQLRSLIDKEKMMHVRAGPESTFQFFITNSAHVFLVQPPRNAAKLVQSQVDVCKRVLNMYRYMVMNISLSDATWWQLLRILLHITRVMLQDVPSPDVGSARHQTVAGRLAGPVFQTLIVSWIKANLFVHVSRELWDELVNVLSSLCHWEELITEWAKNMETMTRVLSRHVYKLDLQDLPLDRLTEQKHKKHKKGAYSGGKSGRIGPPLIPERSFSRGWSRDSVPATYDSADTESKRRHNSARHFDRFTSVEDSSTGAKAESKLNGALESNSKSSPRRRSSTLTSSTEGQPKRGISDIGFALNSTSPPESNSGTLKRHNSASDISLLNKELGHNVSPTRHRSDSDGPNGVEQRSRALTVDSALSNGPHVGWQVPTHEIHNYHYGGSIDASVSTSVSVNSLEPEDEFDELIQERLHANYSEKDQRFAELQEATSLHSQDSVSIDPDWNPWMEPSLLSSTTVDGYVATDESLHSAASKDQKKERDHLNDKSTGSAVHNETSTEHPADDTGLSDNTSLPYSLYQNTTKKKDDSSAHLIPEENQLSLSSFSQDEDANNCSLNEEDFPDDLRNISIVPTTSTEDILTAGSSEIEVAFSESKETIKKRDDLEASSDDILLQHDSHSYSGSKQSSPVHANPVHNKSVLKQTSEDSTRAADDCSIMAGGKKTGWFPDVAVSLWRRLLGVLGDVNLIESGAIHELVFQYLLELWEILFKLRQNIGITSDNKTLPDNQELVPPLRIVAPWAFKASMSLHDSHKEGKLHAYQLLCKMTVQREHDIPLEPEHLAQFYAVLHESLHSTDQDIVNKIIESSSQYFSACLPASNLLLLDFIYACHSIAASDDLKAPRVEAQTILGSTLCFPNIYHDIPVLKPDSIEPSASICSNVKDYVVEALLTSGKKEPSAAARCVALSSTGLWLYEELTSEHQRHSRVKEAINVLLVSLKFNNRTVASVACSQLHLLIHCSNEILNAMPDIPPRIIEVMSLTVSALHTSEAKNSETGRQLLVSLLLCILDWCMAVPLQLLTETYGAQSDKRLIRTVFKALQTAALGKPGHSAKHSYSLSDLASQDFDPNLQLERVQETSIGTNRSKVNASRSGTMKFGKESVVSLAAKTVLNHLTNHLGHFPLARGTSVLTCRVSEHDDVTDAPDELSAALFNSPDVQFLIYNDACLLSVVEIPAEINKPGGGSTAGLSTSNRCVRFILRDAGGKYCWDSTILYGPSNLADSTMPVACEPLSSLDADISACAKRCCESYEDYARIEEQKQHKVAEAAIPLHSDALPQDTPDKLDQLLQYIGWSSPECQTKIGRPLNIPADPPSCISEQLQADASRCMLRHHKALGASNEANATMNSWKCSSTQPRRTVLTHSRFHHARLLCAEMGFLSRDNRSRVNLLTKNERLLRELKNLDSRHCRETHKVAVLYIAEGQEDKLSVLSNTGGSKEYEEFVAGLGWEVDLTTHCGFRGKLQSDGSNGLTSPYYATSTLEVVYHVATRFPSDNEAARNVKIRHLGNDEVHIVWSEHHRDYRRGIIPTEFGDVLIVIYPIRHGLYRVQIIKKQEVPYFGPLFDGAVVNARVLPVLVRETAINAGRAKRSLINLYQPFYEERTRYLRQIIDQFKDDQTFEDYCSDLFSPAPSGIKNVEVVQKSLGTTALSVASSALPRSADALVTLSTDAINSNNNNSAVAEPHWPNPFKDAARRIQNAAIFTHSDSFQPLSSSSTDYLASSVTPRPKFGSPVSSTKSYTASSQKAPGPSASSSSFFFPPPPNHSLSSSAPVIPSRTSRSHSGGGKAHLGFRTNILTKNSGGGSQPHLPESRDCLDIPEFPSPPHNFPDDIPTEILDS